jgi:phage terminase small subunit
MEQKQPPEPLPEPPDHLSERSQGIWREMVPRAKGTGRRTVLEAALVTLDRMTEARVTLQRDGLTSVTARTGAVHLNPLAKLELESRRQFLSYWTALGFERSAWPTGDGGVEHDGR